MLMGCRNRHGVKIERPPHPRGLPAQVFAPPPSPPRGVLLNQGSFPEGGHNGVGPDVASQVQLTDWASLFGSKKTNLSLAMEAVSQCLKGSSVAAIRLR